MSASAAGRARALAFLTALQDACAEQVLPAPGGHALIDRRHALLWDANHLRVEATEPPAVPALLAAAERHLVASPFRAVTLLHEPVADALAAPLAAHGYAPFHELLMLLEREPPPPDPAIAVQEVAGETVATTRLAAARERGSADDAIGRELASRDALIAAATQVRSFAVLDGGALVARCQLYGAGAVAQLENVHTAPLHRGRGYAGALVAHAARTARASGAHMVFLRTDATDWPQQFYRRLGFADAGLLPRFRRTL
jgi:GNAT superfamily N-acetyltransferase